MAAGSATSLRFIVVPGVAVDFELHVAGSIFHGGVRMGGAIIQELRNGGVGILGGGGLLGG